MNGPKLLPICLVLISATLAVCLWLGRSLPEESGHGAVWTEHAPNGAAAQSHPELVAPRAASDRTRTEPRRSKREGDAIPAEEPDEPDEPEGPRSVATIPAHEGPETTIGGHVRTPFGAGLQGLLVSAAPAERNAAPKVWARTDTQGTFEFVVPDDSALAYRVQVAGAPDDSALGNVIRTLKRQGELHREGVTPGTTDLGFELPSPGTADLIVLDAATGLPVLFCTLEWKRVGEEEFRPYGRGQRLQGVGEEGRLHVGLPAGELLLRVSANGYEPRVVAVDVIPHSRSHPTLVELEARAQLVVRFLADSEASEQSLAQLEMATPGAPRFATELFLMTAEERNEHAGEIEGFYFTNHAKLQSQGRVFEKGPDGTFLAYPGEGTYCFAAFPDLITYEPAVITVPPGGKSIDVKVSHWEAFGRIVLFGEEVELR